MPQKSAKPIAKPARSGRISNPDPERPDWTNNLVALRHRAGYRSQQRLADALGMTRSRWATFELGNSLQDNLTYEEKVRLLRKFKVSNEEFVKEVGVPLFYQDVPPPDEFTETGERNAVPKGYARYRLAGIANGGRTIDPESRYVVLPVQEKVRPGSELYGIHGDSMTDPADPDGPHSLNDGELVWADTQQAEPYHGWVFVFKVDGEAPTVKKLEDFDGRWWLRSYNPKYKPTPVDWDRVRIIGKVYLKVPRVEDYKAK